MRAPRDRTVARGHTGNCFLRASLRMMFSTGANKWGKLAINRAPRLTDTRPLD
jgi:hypothetical protein